MTQQHAPYPYAQPQRARFKGLAIAALVLGIVGVVGSIIPILNNVTALAALVGLVLGVIALFGTKKVMAGIGAGLCVLAIVVTIAMQALFLRELDKALGTSVPENGQVETTGEPARLGFGEAHKWSTGEVFSISQPRPHTPSNEFLQAPEGKRFVEFDVTIRNEGDQGYNVVVSSLTVQHNGHVAQQNYFAGDPFPSAQVPPGGDVTFTSVFEIGSEPGELQISVQPTPFAKDTAYFVGQV
ncbi:protein of unknown function [Saccharopolyspora kobensis]|uniref:DUF4352 domain-containing protein n=1 Tax=Saccharopolyspora kobensis TaxID=146035 RepID=A0A1H6C413_9PSEU|nr:DUF4190 domain-containing protein [Saccharopolyspora kobensis]SEG67672.1 protein of unknown function [Saccharopolyspora kobensis]SFC26992.1 protein of unknown function [Saccharopolyspora kobensis]